MVEYVAEGLPTMNVSLDWEQQEETAEGFTVISTTPLNTSVNELEASSSCEVTKVLLFVESVREFRQLLGHEEFLSLAYNLMVGHQVVVRGCPSELVTSIIKCLKVLVPRHCYRAVTHSDTYLELTECNLLGLEPQVAVPQPSATVLRLDILQPQNEDHQQNIKMYTFKIKWGGSMPTKCPTILLKMEKAIENSKLCENVLRRHFISLKEEWLKLLKWKHVLGKTTLSAPNHYSNLELPVIGSLVYCEIRTLTTPSMAIKLMALPIEHRCGIAKVIHRVRLSNGPSEDITGLLRSLGAQDHDKLLLDFWATGLPPGLTTEYRKLRGHAACHGATRVKSSGLPLKPREPGSTTVQGPPSCQTIVAFYQFFKMTVFFPDYADYLLLRAVVRGRLHRQGFLIKASQLLAQPEKQFVLQYHSIFVWRESGKTFLSTTKWDLNLDLSSSAGQGSYQVGGVVLGMTKRNRGEGDPVSGSVLC
uniref:UDENN FLCN/SMCR8-type domain-containing protein n=1 Tax=Timema bartmani TaxID=61472 RepID=A0A7R9HXF9_9NEOP|nr:unnamed protein product [Timema bartmani]